MARARRWGLVRLRFLAALAPHFKVTFILGLLLFGEHAEAIACATDDDLAKLNVALDARRLNPMRMHHRCPFIH